jgi:SagB-type dehydrogenase family enzyme
MIFKSFAEFYHNETKYTPEGLKKNSRTIDWTKQPIPFKTYINSEKINLGDFLKREDSVLSEDEKEIKKLSKILYYTNGITAMIPYNPPLYLRAAPSAGGLYPTEIYIITNNYRGLKDGIYNFNPKTHSIDFFAKGNFYDKLKKACFDDDSLENSKVSILYTGIFYRSEWRYQERAYRRILLDTGHVIGNTIIVSPFYGYYSNLIGSFNDDYINDLLFLNKDEEACLGIISLTNKKLKNRRRVLASEIKKDFSTRLENIILDFHNSTKIDKIIEPNTEKDNNKIKFPFTFGEKIEPRIIDWQNSIEATILKRRSTRAYNASSISKEDLSKILTFTYKTELYKEQGFDYDPDFFDLSIIDTYIAVLNVNGIEDGCYYYSPEKDELKQIRFKNFREDIYYLCLGQNLGRDASVVVFHTSNLPLSVKKYGERAYRYLHMSAGILGQRINLACTKLDIGVSGIGGFFDDEVNNLLGIPDEAVVLYITTIGKPETRLV